MNYLRRKLFGYRILRVVQHTNKNWDAKAKYTQIFWMSRGGHLTDETLDGHWTYDELVKIIKQAPDEETS